MAGQGNTGEMDALLSTRQILRSYRCEQLHRVLALYFQASILHRQVGAAPVYRAADDGLIKLSRQGRMFKVWTKPGILQNHT